MLDQIKDWKKAPLWTPKSINSATKIWFKYMKKENRKPSSGKDITELREENIELHEIIGAVLGSWLMGLINNGLILSGFSTNAQMIARGLILIVAVAIGVKEIKNG